MHHALKNGYLKIKNAPFAKNRLSDYYYIHIYILFINKVRRISSSF
jgi:hypothetical protein